MFWGLSEFLLTVVKRSKRDATSRDRHSLPLIWLVNLAAVTAGIFAAYRLRSWAMPRPKTWQELGYSLFIAGLALRWYAIIHLGRFFTVNVAIARDHRVVDDGPYRFIRHPSYTGGLLAVFGFCLTFDNLASLLIIFVPVCAITLWRIHVEETALLTALGEPYRQYMQKTKRLIPLVY